jgi:UbiD family decarboxylase
MPFEDLRSFIRRVEEIGELKTVRGAHWNLEIGCMAELMAERKGPALLFDEVVDYPAGYRVFVNAFTTVRRTALLFDLPLSYKGLDIVKALRERHRVFKPMPPKEVSDGPVFENKHYGDEVNLYEFPTPRWREFDGGRYIGTGCVCVMRDPDEGWVNAGTYRVMIHDGKTAGLYISPGHDGAIIMQKYHMQHRSCPIAVSLGQDPHLYYASMTPIGWGVSEYDYAGWLRGEPVKVVRGPLTDLPIPATSEIVLEGEVPPPDVELREEGPFGEWTGYYGGERIPRPVIRVKAVYHRNDPILFGNPHFKPPTPSSIAIPHYAANIWDQLEAAGVPDVQGVWVLSFTEASPIIVVAIKQRYGGHAKQAGHIAACCKAGGYANRLVIVVDEDVDITNAEDVLWAVVTRSDFKNIDLISEGWSSRLDTSVPPEKREIGDLTNTRLVINACRPHHRKDFPVVNRSSEELRSKILSKFSHLFD